MHFLPLYKLNGLSAWHCTRRIDYIKCIFSFIKPTTYVDATIRQRIIENSKCHIWLFHLYDYPIETKVKQNISNVKVDFTTKFTIAAVAGYLNALKL